MWTKSVAIKILHVVTKGKTERGKGRKGREYCETASACTSSIEGNIQTKMLEFVTKMSKGTSDNIQALLKVLILATIAGAAISSRLFSVIR